MPNMAEGGSPEMELGAAKESQAICGGGYRVTIQVDNKVGLI